MHSSSVAAFGRIVACACVLFGAGVPVDAQTDAQSGVPAVQTPAAAPALPPAGAIPAQLAMSVTGTPLAANVLYAKIRHALDVAIRPTLRPGSTITYGTVVPWPLAPLAAGTSAAANVSVTIAGDATSAPVAGVTTVAVYNIAYTPAPPVVLYLDDDPEYLQSEGLVFQGAVTPAQPARLYYYHSVIGVPRDVDVVVTATVPSRIHIVSSAAGPDLDVMSVGHSVSRDILSYLQNDEGTIVDVVPGKPYVIHHALVLQGELVAGTVDVQAISGEVNLDVVASAAGASPLAYLAGPRVPYDGHNRHGAFDLATARDLHATYTIGGPDAVVRYGDRGTAPTNRDATDRGRDLGDYGVLHKITFTLANPTDTPHTVYLYQKPLGGPVRSTFIVDGSVKELGCTRVAAPYLVTSYQLAPGSTGASTTLTMTDGGSFYPIEYGVTETPPTPNTPPLGAPDGCSPIATPTPIPAPTFVPTPPVTFPATTPMPSAAPAPSASP
jgi:hypothetical protein